MEDFAGFCGHTRPKHACTVLDIYIKRVINKCTQNQNVWRPSKALSCIFGCNFGPRNLGLKFNEFLVARERHLKGSLKCVKVREPKLLTETRTEQPWLIKYSFHELFDQLPHSWWWLVWPGRLQFGVLKLIYRCECQRKYTILKNYTDPHPMALLGEQKGVRACLLLPLRPRCDLVFGRRTTCVRMRVRVCACAKVAW